MSDGTQLQVIDTNRKADGTFAPGNKANPTGENGHTKGWQRYGTRILKWLEMPVGDIAALAQNEEELAKLSSIDAICVQHVANAMHGRNVLAERRELIDRIEGTPKQTIEHQGSPDQPLYPAVTNTVEEAARAYQDALKSS